jgi:hypothetical protein
MPAALQLRALLRLPLLVSVMLMLAEERYIGCQRP